MILINPFYETTDSVRQILSKKGVNVYKYEREKVLVIIDSLKEYFGQQPNMLFIKKLASNAKQMGKNCPSGMGRQVDGRWVFHGIILFNNTHSKSLSFLNNSIGLSKSVLGNETDRIWLVK